MDTVTTSSTPSAPPTGADPRQPSEQPVSLGAEVRQSAVLLLLSVAVTAGLSGAAQAVLAALS